MDSAKTQIPFVLNSQAGIVEVLYEENSSESKSGFDLLKNLGFNADLCIGYPTMHAYVKECSATGYGRGSAWIQIITDQFFNSLQDEVPLKEVSVDVSGKMRSLGVPFFAMGYPSEIYDAPCNNLENHARLKWTADTFLVDQPSRINDNTISFVCGFRWGYEEWDVERKRNVRILPLEVIDYSIWNGHLVKLKEDFPNWDFK